VAVRELVGMAGTGERRLERLFEREVGLSPRATCGVMRVQHAADRLRREPALPLAWLALEGGYADQSHFTREFRRLAGVTPAVYRTEQAAAAAARVQRTRA
jgi:transcriptional regulator GlxA family with amidase domain